MSLLSGNRGRYAKADNDATAEVGTPGWLNPLTILVALAAGAMMLAFILDLPCYLSEFSGEHRYTAMCYSDLPYLYVDRGFQAGIFPYIQQLPDVQALEYPVLTGLFIWATALLAGGEVLTFFNINIILLSACFIGTVLATAVTVRRRAWDALYVALAPTVIAAAFINWDLFTVLLTALALLAWSRRQPVLAGLLLGAGIAGKFYPLFLLGPLFLLCLRSGTLRSFWKTFLATLAAWLVINAPFMVFGYDGWLEFFAFSQTRSTEVGDFGSIWFALYQFGIEIPAINLLGTASFAILCLGIGFLALAAPRRPRLAQLAFLVVAAFCLTNKVYSPQFVIWLVPLAALARPKLPAFLMWQAGELIYFAGIWWFLQQYGTEDFGLPDEGYALATLIRIAATIAFAGFIIRDIWRGTDVIRADGSDDPGGGVLDGTADVLPPLFQFRSRGRLPNNAALEPELK